MTAIHLRDNIYVDSEKVSSEKDLLDDLLHEFAHRFEENNSEKIYEDGSIANEFLGKRKRLFYMLDEPMDMMLDYINPEYDKKFDNYLYKNVGYDKLRSMTHSLFFSPYAITALKEYWANGFENYLLGSRGKLKEISPALYEKIDSFF